MNDDRQGLETTMRTPDQRDSSGLYTSKYPFSPILSGIFNSFVRLYVRPIVTGRDYIPKDGPFILVANHSSHADTAVVFAVLPQHLLRRVVAAAAQDYFFDNGVREWASRSLYNSIPIDRKATGGLDPLRHASRALREGYGLLIYPEGTRSKDGSIAQFRSGIGMLIAKHPNVPVIPVWLDTGRVMRKGEIFPRPVQVCIRFGEPMYLSADPDHSSTWRATAAEVRDAVIHLSELPPEPRRSWRSQLSDAWHSWRHPREADS